MRLLLSAFGGCFKEKQPPLQATSGQAIPNPAAPWQLKEAEHSVETLVKATTVSSSGVETNIVQRDAASLSLRSSGGTAADGKTTGQNALSREDGSRTVRTVRSVRFNVGNEPENEGNAVGRSRFNSGTSSLASSPATSSLLPKTSAGTAIGAGNQNVSHEDTNSASRPLISAARALRPQDSRSSANTTTTMTTMSRVESMRSSTNRSSVRSAGTLPSTSTTQAPSQPICIVVSDTQTADARQDGALVKLLASNYIVLQGDEDEELPQHHSQPQLVQHPFRRQGSSSGLDGQQPPASADGSSARVSGSPAPASHLGTVVHRHSLTDLSKAGTEASSTKQVSLAAATSATQPCVEDRTEDHRSTTSSSRAVARNRSFGREGSPAPEDSGRSKTASPLSASASHLLLSVQEAAEPSVGSASDTGAATAGGMLSPQDLSSSLEAASFSDGVRGGTGNTSSGSISGRRPNSLLIQDGPLWAAHHESGPMGTPMVFVCGAPPAHSEQQTPPPPPPYLVQHPHVHGSSLPPRTHRRARSSWMRGREQREASRLAQAVSSGGTGGNSGVLQFTSMQYSLAGEIRSAPSVVPNTSHTSPGALRPSPRSAVGNSSAGHLPGGGSPFGKFVETQWGGGAAQSLAAAGDPSAPGGCDPSSPWVLAPALVPSSSLPASEASLAAGGHPGQGSGAAPGLAGAGASAAGSAAGGSDGSSGSMLGGSSALKVAISEVAMSHSGAPAAPGSGSLSNSNNALHWADDLPMLVLLGQGRHPLSSSAPLPRMRGSGASFWRYTSAITSAGTGQLQPIGVPLNSACSLFVRSTSDLMSIQEGEEGEEESQSGTTARGVSGEGSGAGEVHTSSRSSGGANTATTANNIHSSSTTPPNHSQTRRSSSESGAGALSCQHHSNQGPRSSLGPRLSLGAGSVTHSSAGSKSRSSAGQQDRSSHEAAAMPSTLH